MKKFFSLLTHRIAVVGLLIVLQAAILIGVSVFFQEYLVQFYWLGIAIAILAIIIVVGNKSDPGYKIAWIVPITAFPLVGGLFYLLFGNNQMSGALRRKMQGMERGMIEALRDDFRADSMEGTDPDSVQQARYLERYAHCPVYRNTVTEYFPLGDDAFPRMLEELRAAQRYIFLEYFIIEPGIFWDSILEILKEKAESGVDVRVIYDDIGSMFTLPKDYAAKLERTTKIRCCAFNRFVPILSLRLNNRDHRKLCIVDGHTAFTGGINLADEYINRKVKYGHWKDSAILVKGDAAWSMTVMFLSMWGYIRNVKENFSALRPMVLPPECAARTGHYVQPYTDSPLDHEAVGETVYLNLICKAKHYVYIMSPYLIISDSVNTALCNAAKSGVDVRILTPHVPDKKVVFEVTRAHYLPLLEAGVRIYEYTPGFVHAKSFAVDDLWGTVGTVNMDYRSMFLHFENGVWLCNDPTVLAIKKDFLETQAKSQPITLERCRSHPLPRRILRAVLRVFAPLM